MYKWESHSLLLAHIIEEIEDAPTGRWTFSLALSLAAPTRRSSSGSLNSLPTAQTSARMSARASGRQRCNDVVCVNFSHDQKYLAVAVLDTTVKVFFADKLNFCLSLYGHKLSVLSIDISKDSTLLLTGLGNKNSKLWGLDFGDCHKSFSVHDDAVTAVKFVGQPTIFLKGKLVKQGDSDKFDHIMT